MTDAYTRWPKLMALNVKRGLIKRLGENEDVQPLFDAIEEALPYDNA